MATTPRRRLSALLLACLLLSALAAFPADKKPPKDFALIYTTVYSPQKLGQYGVRVKVRRAIEKKSRWEGVSDHAGEVAFRVPPGPADYIVWADIKVRKGQSRPETKVHVEGDERVDVSLHLTE